MIALRVLGGVFAVGLLAISSYRYRGRGISRLNLIISWILGLVIAMLAVAPVVFDPIFNAFNFKPKSHGRLLFVELGAILALFALIVRNMAYADVSVRSIRELVEALAIQSFDWTATEELPEGRRIVVANHSTNIGIIKLFDFKGVAVCAVELGTISPILLMQPRVLPPAVRHLPTVASGNPEFDAKRPMILSNYWKAVVELLVDEQSPKSSVIFKTIGVDLFHIVSATVVMKLTSPYQRGNTCIWICPAIPAPAHLPRFIPTFTPPAPYTSRKARSARAA